jgi:RNA polymerase sigma-70 factor, ECF subfamily
VPDHADDVAGRVDQQELLADMMAALATLRTAEREVLALCGWAGLDYAEAAQALGIPVGTVRSRLSRARAKLARRLADGWEPSPRNGQVLDDRDSAVPLTQETAS